MESRSVSILSLPQELQFGIVYWLSKDDIKSLSSCSRACRNLGLPFLFRTFTIRPSLVGKDAGCLSHITKYARELILDGGEYDRKITRTLAEALQAVTVYRFIESRFNLFPNIKSLVVIYNTAFDIEYNLYMAFFPKLSEAVFWKNLRRISLNLKARFRVSATIDDGNGAESTFTENIYEHLSDADREYLGPRTIKWGDRKGIELVLPPNIEEVRIENQYFYLYGLNEPSIGNTRLRSKCYFYLDPTRLHKLKKMDIKVVNPKLRQRRVREVSGMVVESLTKSCSDLVVVPYPGVTHLKYECHAFEREDIEDTVRFFPNLTDLVISNEYTLMFEKDEAIYHPQVKGLKHLRSIELPWPKNPEEIDRYDEQLDEEEEDSGFRNIFASVKKLRSIVESWQMGNINLERVTFRRYGDILRTRIYEDEDDCPKVPEFRAIAMTKRNQGWEYVFTD